MDWQCPFVLPFWLQTCRKHLGSADEPHILTVNQGSTPIGHVPLTVSGSSARFLGLADVCDYQDIVARPGAEAVVMEAAANFLKSEGITHLDLQALRPDAMGLRALNVLALEEAVALETVPCDVTFETMLPQAWDDYLMQLSAKQRHEVRRKIRRLQDHGQIHYRQAGSSANLAPDIETFLQLFKLNRADKAAFMNADMTGYFEELMRHLAAEKMLRLYFLFVDDVPAAAALCFDYSGVRYLYNSGYDARFQHLSVGVLCKIFSIQNAIASECRKYDLLKGAEAYKKRIGGQPTALYRCKVEL